MSKIYGKWLNYLINDLNMWELTREFGKFLKYLGNGLGRWGTV